MIYIKRFLWALGWVPVFILGLVLCLVSIISCPFVCMFYYIKNGDVETTPDRYLPMYCAIQLEIVYRKLEPKTNKEGVRYEKENNIETSPRNR